MSAPEARVYGMADENNRQEPAPGGMRGEGSAAGEAPALRHDATVGDRQVQVQESSGVAFVEAEGASGGIAAQDQPASDRPGADEKSSGEEI